MKEIFMLGQAYEKEIMLGMMVLLLVLSMISLLMISATKRKLNHVLKIVQDYLEAVCAEETEGSNVNREKSPAEVAVHTETKEKLVKKSKDEEQSRIISSVLQEIFP